jgi:hypothetical protein
LRAVQAPAGPQQNPGKPRQKPLQGATEGRDPANREMIGSSFRVA